MTTDKSFTPNDKALVSATVVDLATMMLTHPGQIEPYELLDLGNRLCMLEALSEAMGVVVKHGASGFSIYRDDDGDVDSWRSILEIKWGDVTVSTLEESRDEVDEYCKVAKQTQPDYDDLSEDLQGWQDAHAYDFEGANDSIFKAEFSCSTTRDELMIKALGEKLSAGVMARTLVAREGQHRPKRGVVRARA